MQRVCDFFHFVRLLCLILASFMVGNVFKFSTSQPSAQRPSLSPTNSSPVMALPVSKGAKKYKLVGTVSALKEV